MKPSPLPDASVDAASDAPLIARLRRRDEEALGEPYDRHAGAVYGLALRMLTEEHAARSGAGPVSRPVGAPGAF